MSAKFFDFEFQPRTSNQGSDFGAQSDRRLLRLVCGAPKNIADFFFHAAAVAPGAALQAPLHTFFKFPNYNLRHGPTLHSRVIS